MQLDHRLDVAAGADNLQECGGTGSRVNITPTGSLVVAGGDRLANTILEVDGLLDLQGGTFAMSGAAPSGSDGGHIAVAAAAGLAVSEEASRSRRAE